MNEIYSNFSIIINISIKFALIFYLKTNNGGGIFTCIYYQKNITAFANILNNQVIIRKY